MIAEAVLCVACSAPYQRKRNNQLYCSSRCSARAKRRRNRVMQYRAHKKWALRNAASILALARKRRAARSVEKRAHDAELGRLRRQRNKGKIRERARKLYEARPEIWILSNIRTRARQAGIPCTITTKDILPPRMCPVLGIKLKRNRRGRESGPQDNSPSVDRIDPSRGYVPGNVIVVSQKANRIKQNATPAEIECVAVFYRRLLGASA